MRESFRCQLHDSSFSAVTRELDLLFDIQSGEGPIRVCHSPHWLTVETNEVDGER